MILHKITSLKVYIVIYTLFTILSQVRGKKVTNLSLYVVLRSTAAIIHYCFPNFGIIFYFLGTQWGGIFVYSTPASCVDAFFARRDVDQLVIY